LFKTINVTIVIYYNGHGDNFSSILGWFMKSCGLNKIPWCNTAIRL